MRLNRGKCHFSKSSIFPHGTRRGWSQHPRRRGVASLLREAGTKLLEQGRGPHAESRGRNVSSGPLPPWGLSWAVSARAAFTWRNWMQGRKRHGWPGWLGLLLPLEPSIPCPVSKVCCGECGSPAPPHTPTHTGMNFCPTARLLTTARSQLLPTLNLCLSGFEIYWKIQVTGSELILWPLWRLAQGNWCVSQLWVKQNVWSPLSGNLLKITKGAALEKNVTLRTLGTGMGRFKVSPTDVLDVLNILARGCQCSLITGPLVHRWLFLFTWGTVCSILETVRFSAYRTRDSHSEDAGRDW